MYLLSKGINVSKVNRDEYIDSKNVLEQKIVRLRINVYILWFILFCLSVYVVYIHFNFYFEILSVKAISTQNQEIIKYQDDSIKTIDATIVIISQDNKEILSKLNLKSSGEKFLFKNRNNTNKTNIKN